MHQPETTVTDFWECPRCSLPCEVLHLLNQSLSVCCREPVVLRRKTRVARNLLPVTHYLHQPHLIAG